MYNELNKIRLFGINEMASHIYKYGFKLEEVPKQYVLGKNHHIFWFNKGKWLHERYLDLADEIITRGNLISYGRWNDTF